jgi:hypothetical protein
MLGQVGKHQGVAVSQEKLKLPQIELATYFQWAVSLSQRPTIFTAPYGCRMTKPPIPLIAKDLAQFTRALARQLGESAPSHLTLMNMLARAAGFQNVQHMRAASDAAPPIDTPPQIAPPLPKPDAKLVERVLMQFDDQGRLRQWPAKRAVQTLALWALWAAIPAGKRLGEGAISAILQGEHSFADPATLRRTMISCRMLTRQAGGVDYLRIEQVPPPEAKALIAAVIARRKGRAGA